MASRDRSATGPSNASPLGGAAGDRGLGRRKFLGRSLRAAGISVALPALESLLPPRLALSAAADSAEPSAHPLRMAFLYVPNGVIMDRWRPTGEGSGFTLGPSLQPLEPYRDQIQIVSGLAHRNGFAGPDGAGDHARATATILTGARPHKTAGADIRVGVSVDQLAARHLGRSTRFPSLELSCDSARRSGSCDSGYSCAYSFNMSWRTENQPASPESNPRAVFERLFGEGTAAERAANLAARQRGRRSVLDFVLEESRSLRGTLAAADRRKLDEYFSGVREIERHVADFDRFPIPEVEDLPLPDRPPASYGEHIRLMADLLVLAFRTDSTRIATFMLAHDGSNRSFPELGVGDGHHSLSHHQGKEEWIAKLATIDRFYAEQLAYLLSRLAETREADGRSLLSNAMVVYASGLSDGNRHRHDDLPVILAGAAGGRLAAGRHLRLPAERPMADLYLTMLDILGVREDRFGDSTGRLDAVLA
jgi:hypothetical protein